MVLASIITHQQRKKVQISVGRYNGTVDDAECGCLRIEREGGRGGDGRWGGCHVQGWEEGGWKGGGRGVESGRNPREPSAFWISCALKHVSAHAQMSYRFERGALSDSARSGEAGKP